MSQSQLIRNRSFLVVRQSIRFYNFGKTVNEKPAKIIPKDKIDMDISKIEKDTFKYDFSPIESQIELLFDPYKELGLDRNATISELQKKMKFERKNLDIQINHLKAKTEYDKTRLEELNARSDIVDEALIIFSSFAERKRFDDNYALQVHKIINSNLTRRQKRILAVDRLKNKISQKIYESTPTTIQSRTDMVIKYGGNKKQVLIDNINVPHRRATILFNFIPFLFAFIVIIPVIFDIELEDSVSFKTAKAMYPEHEYYSLHYLYGWWLTFKSFYYRQGKEKLWDKYIEGISDTERINRRYSVVNEFENRDTELIQLASKLEKLANKEP